VQDDGLRPKAGTRLKYWRTSVGFGGLLVEAPPHRFDDLRPGKPDILEYEIRHFQKAFVFALVPEIFHYAADEA
jgi:hypothetical protein